MVKEPVDLSGAQPRWPEHARDLWARCATRAAQDAELWRRPAAGGDPKLRAALAARYGLDPAHLTVVAGVRAAALALRDQHRTVAVESPTFLGLSAQLGGGQPLTQVDDLSTPLEPGTLLVVTSPARNPDGACLGDADRSAIVAHLAAGVRVIVNETYREWYPAFPRVPGADVMASLHKIAGIGARLGFVHSPTFLEASVPHLAATEPPLPWQRTWALFLEGGGLDELVAATVQPSAAAAAAYDAILDELRRPQAAGAAIAPRSGPHRVLPLPGGVTEQEALQRLDEAGYLANPASAFGMRAPAVRFCFVGVDTPVAVNLPAVLAELGLLEQRVTDRWPDEEGAWR